jgi:4-hydroxybenzoate polyprenyltransferase
MDRARVSVYRFGRFSALSFTLMLPLLGAAIGTEAVPLALLVCLALMATAFHLFAYITNDVADLALDRTEPLRSDSPLVRGLVHPSIALVVALVQIPFAFAILAFVGNAAAAGALATAMALMAVYNWMGKRLRFPFWSDAIQSLGWVSLALAGALSTGKALNTMTLVFAALVFIYVLLINGIHGGLRDLENDRRGGARTTAIFFGAHVRADSVLVVPPAMVAYAFALQAVMGLVSTAAVWYYVSTAASTSTWPAIAAVAGTQLLLLWLLWRTLAATGRRTDMIRSGIIHLFVSLASLMLPFAWSMDIGATATIFAAFAIPVAVMCWHDGVTWESA